ncbi:hypothetical protein H839_08569 [Parageobacillus genomosp. 1]|uniref:Uncharacterized protein n=1 Tax=Parageobacillus genomosp. 1 TaxID=1295642 RepID=A0ABC9VGY5_9BACL|nr:hypothetical protein [Parageobacillus genomosp. 1]EZP77673.1 hypothetical protein H839_08569 [Parageobacillus genomosp. 1]
MDHLNYFFPYERKDAHHEDQLTRAFLVTLKLVPLIQHMFIEMIREKMFEKNVNHENIVPSLVSAEYRIERIETQVKKINQDSGKLVSILISDDEFITDHKVHNSERDAVYDGVIYYKPDFIFIIENKPNKEHVWVEQLNPSLPADTQIIIEETPICLSWRNIIERINRLLDKDLVTGTEAALLSDFLRFIDKKFKFLNPYTTLSVCKDDEYLLKQRCISIMEDLNLGPVDYHKSWKNYILVDYGPVKQIAVAPNFKDDGEWSIELEFYAGDTMNQARTFFNNVDVDELLALEHKGWSLEPNFHFAFQGTNLLYPTTRVGIRDYIEFWKDKEIKQLNKAKINEYQLFINELIQHNMMTPDDKNKLVELFDNTERQTLNVCPGLYFGYRWSKSEAIKLDSAGQLTDAIKEKIQEATRTWGLSLVR